MKILSLLFLTFVIAQQAVAGGTPCMFKPGGCNGDEYGKARPSTQQQAITLKSILDPKAGGACCSWGAIKNCFPGC